MRRATALPCPRTLHPAQLARPAYLARPARPADRARPDNPCHPVHVHFALPCAPCTTCSVASAALSPRRERTPGTPLTRRRRGFAMGAPGVPMQAAMAGMSGSKLAPLERRGRLFGAECGRRAPAGATGVGNLARWPEKSLDIVRDSPPVDHGVALSRSPPQFSRAEARPGAVALRPPGRPVGAHGLRRRARPRLRGANGLRARSLAAPRSGGAARHGQGGAARQRVPRSRMSPEACGLDPGIALYLNRVINSSGPGAVPKVVHPGSLSFADADRVSWQGPAVGRMRLLARPGVGPASPD